jgi:dTDP-glucose 4,6-dehydratase
MKVLVTGGNGFIGSNFIEFLLKDSGADVKVLNFDKETYAGRGKNIEHMNFIDKGPFMGSRYSYLKGDIAKKMDVLGAFDYEPDYVFNFAAESHVDRSIVNSNNFVTSNVLGAVNLMDSALEKGVKRFIQISTDEVYGSRKDGSFNEGDKLDARSPYSASKASADLYALSYFKTHKLPIVITRSANNYGPYQFPEKLLPLFITNLIENKKVPLMWSEENPGLNVRDWLHVKDNCRAIWLAGTRGKIGEIYNIPGENEKANIYMTEKLLKAFGKNRSWIKKVEHRKGHDFRYSISGDKIRDLGFEYEHKDLDKELDKTIDWYIRNENWWGALKR